MHFKKTGSSGISVETREHYFPSLDGRGYSPSPIKGEGIRMLPSTYFPEEPKNSLRLVEQNTDFKRFIMINTDNSMNIFI